jgi:hypothetical protein
MSVLFQKSNNAVRSEIITQNIFERFKNSFGCACLPPGLAMIEIAPRILHLCEKTERRERKCNNFDQVDWLLRTSKLCDVLRNQLSFHNLCHDRVLTKINHHLLTLRQGVEIHSKAPSRPELFRAISMIFEHFWFRNE